MQNGMTELEEQVYFWARLWMKSSKIIEMLLIFLFHENLFSLIIIELDVVKVNMLLEPLQVYHCVEGHVYSSDV